MTYCQYNIIIVFTVLCVPHYLPAATLVHVYYTIIITNLGINALCWFGVSVSLLWLDPLGLLGIRDPLYQLLGWCALVSFCIIAYYSYSWKCWQ